MRQYTTIDDDRIGCRCCESLPDTPCPAWCDYAQRSIKQEIAEINRQTELIREARLELERELAEMDQQERDSNG